MPRSRRLLAALPDERLVDQIRRGNAAAFEVVYDRHYRGILSFCLHMLGSREEAEDALQQTFASAYSGLQGDERDIRLKAWLYTIARNRCLSVLRARREQAAELEDVPALGGLSEEVQQRADLRELLHDLGELPDDQREALVLYEIGDLSQAEVADVIGVEPVKVKALVFQARSTLIENRDARAIPCTEIREQLATASGGALRRGPLRRHVKACEGCRDFRDQVRSQRSALALVLPVAPTVGLKDTVLAGLGFGGGAGGAGAAAGGAAGALGGSGFLGSIGGVGIAKLSVGAVLAAGAVAGGGMAVERSVGGDDGVEPRAEAAEANGGGSSQGGASAVDPGGPGGSVAAAGTSGERERAADRREERARERKRKRRNDKDGSRRNGSSESGDSGSRGGADARGGSSNGNRGQGKSRGRRGNANLIGRGRGVRKAPKPPRAPGGGSYSGGSGSGGDSGSNSGGTQRTPTRPPRPEAVDADGRRGTSTTQTGDGTEGKKTDVKPRMRLPDVLPE